MGQAHTVVDSSRRLPPAHTVVDSLRRLPPPCTVVNSSKHLPPVRMVVDSSRRLCLFSVVDSSRSLCLFSLEVHHAKQRSFLEASTYCEPQHTSSHHCDLFRGHGDFDVASLSW